MTVNEWSNLIWGLIVGNITRGWFMKNFVAKIVAFFSADVFKKIIACLPAIVAEVEKAMADGKITPEERKDLAMKAVDIIATQFNIKVTGIMKWVISVIIDNIAKRLPSKDIAVPKTVIDAVKQIGG